MLNFISNKKALALAVIMLSFSSMSIYAAACASPSGVNCCGNGILDTGEGCDMGFGKNIGGTDSISGCTSSCQVVTGDPTGTWTCSTTPTDYTAKVTRLKGLFIKLANWHAGFQTSFAADGTATTGSAITGIANTTNVKDDCSYYDSNLKPIIRPAWAAAANYNCAQYQKDMLEFITLNYNTPSGVLDCNRARSAMRLGATATIEFANPLPTNVVPVTSNVTPVTTHLNSTTYLYVVKGC